MVSLSEGSVVLVRFPFSDLSSSKLRPAVVIASASRNDWILCQVTSNPYNDTTSVQITDSNFETGSLQRISYARPAKLFTANSSLIETEVGKLNAVAFNNIVSVVIDILQMAMKAK
ncbi:MAG: type II toxin-antitoxin system PemK/MazF family toxin [Thermodesulfobacteriota bacterium]|nr:type II toxin-antitoxin system PemK/MazF family toxin [Thermodesulfobacteriota bacterium]